MKFEMNNTHSNELALSAQRDVITTCDYGTCPTIKSNNAINTLIVVKCDGNLQSIEARRDRGYDNYRSEEHTSELQSRPHIVCRLLLEKKKYIFIIFFFFF